MKNFVLGMVLFSLVCVMVAGCGVSEESQLAGKELPLSDKEVVETNQVPLEDDFNFNEYVKSVEGQLGYLEDIHVKLADRVRKAGLEPETQTTFNTTLDALKMKREVVHTQIEALKRGNKKNWTARQLGMDVALEHLAHSYDEALAQFAGQSAVFQKQKIWTDTLSIPGYADL